MCNFLLVTTLATYINRTPIKNNMSHLLVRIRLTLPLDSLVSILNYKIDKTEKNVSLV